MTDVHTRPETVEQGSRETLPWRFDPTALLGAGEVPSAPTATLTNLSTGVLYPAGLSGAATLSGVYITQRVTALAAHTTYRLSVGFTTTVTGKVFECWLDIFCPG
jgi:hypothetical protein